MLDKKTERLLESLNRSQLIATYYMLKENESDLIKEEQIMKNGKFSNRTKAVAGITVALGVATVISGIKDYRDLKEIEMVAGDISAVLEDIKDTVEDVVNNPDTVITF